MADVSRAEAAQELLWRRATAETADGFLTFFQHLWYVQVPRKGPQHPQARPFQRRVVEMLMEPSDHPLLLAVLKARQIGFTTVMMAFAVWWSLTHSDSPWLLASRNEDAAKKNLTRAAYGYRRLPVWFKARCPDVITDSTERLSWANESRIDSIPASAGSGRSDSVYGVLFDEAAHMDNPSELFASLDPLCYGPFIVFSSANGMGNWFHQIWQEGGLDDSAWRTLFCPWTEVDTRDQDWYTRTARKYRGQMWLFYQEYPSNEVEAFARSGRVAYGIDVLEPLNLRPPTWRVAWDGVNLDTEHPLLPGAEADLELWVWEWPTILRGPDGRVSQPPNYTVFCDTAEGLERGDQTAIAVWNANTQALVATCLTRWPIEDLDDVLAAVGHWYHGALLIVERNNQGLVPIVGLQKKHRYPRMYRMPELGAIPVGDRTPRYGWITSRQSKPKMVHDFLKALREAAVDVPDRRWVMQANTFVADGKGGYAASENNHDDLMIAVIGGWQGVLDVGRYPVVWADATPQPPTWGDVLSLFDHKPHAGSGSLRIGGERHSHGAVRRSFEQWPAQEGA